MVEADRCQVPRRADLERTKEDQATFVRRVRALGSSGGASGERGQLPGGSRGA